MNTSTYAVVGMTCAHCVLSVTEEVGRVPGVRDVDTDLPSGQVTVRHDAAIDDEAIKAAVEEAGYVLAAS